MAIEKKGNVWYNTDTRRYTMNDPVAVGDTVVCLTNASSSYRVGDTDEVIHVSNGSYEHIYVDGAYQYIYWQNVKLKNGGGNTRSMKNWSKAEKRNNVLAIETNRPTLVVEVKEIVENGTAVFKEVGEPVVLDSLSSARVYASNEISESIRKDNTYRQFRIYQEHSIARAKKPEIEFA